MSGVFSTVSIAPQSVRYKLLIAFVLMSIIPLLVSIYVVSQFFPVMKQAMLGQVSVLLLVSIIISWFGLLLAKAITDSIIDLSIEARLIASGQLNKDSVTVLGDDEVGVLGNSINTIISHIKDNIKELKGYSEKTQEINVNIHKKMVALNDLLQISDLISLSADVEKIAEIMAGKLSQIYDNGYAAIFLTKDDENEFLPVAVVSQKEVHILREKIRSGSGFFGNVVLNKKSVVMDSSHVKPSSENLFREKHKLDNFIAVPLVVGKKTMGVLVAGNHIRDCIFNAEDIAMIKVFAKQMMLTIENHLMIKQAEIRSYKDELTGLYNRSYIITRLNEEIERAILYQRPCSFVLIDLDNFKEYGNARGQLAAESAAIRVAGLIKNMLVEPVDKAGRIGDDEFAIIFPEKSKRSAIQLAEGLRKEIQSLNLSSDPKDRVSASMGVSENPLDGVSGAHIMDKARAAVKKAKNAGKNRVET